MKIVDAARVGSQFSSKFFIRDARPKDDMSLTRRFIARLFQVYLTQKR